MDPALITVIDADTVVVIAGSPPEAVKSRLLGHDAPEIGSYKCRAERHLGIKAAARLVELIHSGKVEWLPNGQYDRWGRALALLKVDGKDVAETLIAEGLAVPYDGRRHKGWCAVRKAKAE